MKTLNRSFLLLVFALFTTWPIASALSADKGAERLKAKTTPKPPPKDDQEKKPETPKDEEKPFDEVIKDMEVIKGLFTFYRKADDNRILMEVLPEQIERTFLFAGTVDQSVGEKGLYAAQMGGSFPFYFRKIGKTIQWLARNPTFTAANGTPAAKATARSFPDSLLASVKVKSQPHKERKSHLIDASDLVIGDLPGFANALKEIYKPTEYSFDRGNSHVTGVKAFPENVLLDLWLHYSASNPKTPSVTLPDARSVPIGVKYEFSALKETPYKPRVADDRVGYFLTVQQDFTSDRPSSPYVRRVNRWHLEKPDPNAPLCPPKEPIVFWLENTIPVEYRDWMKQGVLLWNNAFEKIGFKDAIVVKQMPDDADWDPADTRYNTIRWFAGVDATFAIGPSRANPFTGQIYDADIGFSEGILRSIRRQGEEFVAPVLPPLETAPAAIPTIWNRHSHHVCDYAEGLAQQAAFGINVLDARGALTPDVQEKLMREFLIEVTAHEVGHTLGLRHNFRASTILKPEELNDVRKTTELSQAGSVMDYNPIIIAAKGERQGHFVPITLGPYDYWAIEYAYKPITGDEPAELKKIASRAADPLLPYSTDEDALGTYSPNAIDPLVNQFDASSNPLAYFRKRFGIIHELWASMENALLKPGEGYQILRRSLARGLNEYFRGLVTSSKFVGGVYHYRDHVGDPDGRPPFAPVPADKQREALELLKNYAFKEDTFRLPATLLNRLAAERLPGLDGIQGLFGAQRIDYPWHDSVLNLQRAVLNRLYHAATLSRVLDNELRFAADEKPFLMADLFGGLDTSIWSELNADAARISSLRRNLQREQLKQLIRLVLRSGQSGIPEDATTLARASLEDTQAKIKRVLAANSVIDATTRAHLQETDARITAALQAQMQKPME
jgi:uncharacterized protein DUF4953/uncharacterized protein DUF5117